MEKASLYDRIGGEETLRQLTDKFYDYVFADEQIARLFKNDKDEIKEKQRLFLTQFLGGPSLYSDVHGHPRLRARHIPHTITEADALAWLTCMDKAITSLEISRELKEELFARFPQSALFMVNS